MKLRSVVAAFAVAAFLLGSRALAQSSTFNFEDNTDQGFGTGFGNDASKSFPIVNIGGSNRMGVARTGAFQEAGRESGNVAEAFYQAMAAAANNEAGYAIGYDWYVDTSAGGYGTFLQLGTYVNTGSGYYAQDFPGTNKEVELNGTQLASGAVFSGHVEVNMAAAGFDMPPNGTKPTPDAFFRIGFITNGNGANPGGAADTVYFDNVTVHPVPEPATVGIAGLAASGLMLRRRRSR